MPERVGYAEKEGQKAKEEEGGRRREDGRVGGRCAGAG